MILREAGWRDVFFLWRIRNHPTSREGMRDTSPIGLREHLKWFRGMLAHSKMTQYVGTEPIGSLWQWKRVGAGRLDIKEIRHPQCDSEVPITYAEIDVVIDPKRRGEGRGRRLIRELALRAFDTPRMSFVLAVIKKDNEASIRAFGRAGFRSDDGALQSAGYVRMEYRP